MMDARSLLRRVNAAAGHAIGALGPSGPTAPVPIGPVRRLLVVKLVGMGDAVLMRSLIVHLQRACPSIELGILAGPTTREVLETLPHVRLHTYDPARADFGVSRTAAKVREIRAASYDAVIDFEQHILLVAAFLAMTRIATRIGLASPGSPRARFQTHSAPLTGDDHMWHAYASLVRMLAPGLLPLSAVPIPIADAVAHDVRQWWHANGMDDSTRAVALHMGCGSTAVARRWPVSRFVELACELEAHGIADRFVLTGSASEAALAEAFAQVCSSRAVSAMHLPSLQHTAETLRRCSLLISNDTGVMHLAAAMGTPTVGLFGPNSPARYSPIGPKALAIYRTRVACSPCIHIHDGVVPECFNPVRGECLLDIKASDVLAAAACFNNADSRPLPLIRRDERLVVVSG
jgi:heptosyltransferase-2